MTYRVCAKTILSPPKKKKIPTRHKNKFHWQGETLITIQVERTWDSLEYSRISRGTPMEGKPSCKQRNSNKNRTELGK